MKKVLILGNSHLVVFDFRGELIEALIQEGYEVIVSFPNSEFGDGEPSSKKYKCKFIETKIDRRGTNPFHDINLLRQYIKIINDEKPDIVLTYTVKCDIYGGIACGICKVPFMPNITGIGKGMAEGGKLERLLTLLYKISLRNAAVVFFQNKNDLNYFQKKNIYFRRSVLLPGSGVNLIKFQPLEFPQNSPIQFLFYSRIMKSKGIDQFLEAARVIKKKYPETIFHICGLFEEDYEDIVNSEIKNGTIIYHGFVHNIIEYEKICHCVILPTYHPEGISNVLLETAACARPVITTNQPGCKEVVEDGITGFLVKEKDSEDLIEKIETFMSLQIQEMAQMGRNGREKIEKEFDRQIIVKEYLKEINNL